MSEYLWTASPVLHTRSHLGILFFIETHRRILKGEFGRIPRHLSDAATAEGGYCVDAPESLPAGACYYHQCDAETGLPAQLELEREPASLSTPKEP
jgi:hypothetical protein